MNIPNLPIDNINKFFFFAGILILIYIYTYKDKERNELGLERAKIGIEFDKLDFQGQNLKDDFKSLHDQQNQYSKKIDVANDNIKKGIWPSKNDMDIILTELSDMQKYGKDLDQRFVDHEQNVIEVKSKLKMISDREKDIDIESKANRGFIYSGCAWLLVGLIYWIVQQKKIDKIFNNEYNKAMNENISTICQSCGMALKYSHEIHL